ncbi:unnamed protein product [Anisakis simplex]|uniref:E3 ubiquitin-protein ligase n=1 Tax=Anisakis simplex TaxID=6269 RepID=A0A0M3J9Z0_ANISI|nr:unnamed protein product [Anisakis simplex]
MQAVSNGYEKVFSSGTLDCSISKGDSQSHSRGGHRLHSSSTGSGEFGLSSSSLSPNAAAILSSTLPNSTLEDSAIGILMSYLKRSVIVQTLPDDTPTKLGITEGTQRSPLQDQLDTVVTVCCTDQISHDQQLIVLNCFVVLRSRLRQ